VLKTLSKVVSIVLAAIAVVSVAFSRPALAADLANGAKIFGANCAACHMGGANVIMANKTLKSDALSKYLDKYSDDPVAAIAYQVTNGKNAMPAFGGRLSAAQIQDVASYVADQATKNWKG
jgi:cytochrome c6